LFRVSAIEANQAPLAEAASNSPFVTYSDPLIDPAATPLLAGEERVVMVSRLVLRKDAAPSDRGVAERPVRVLQEPIITAGLFPMASLLATRLAYSAGVPSEQYADRSGDDVRNAV
jgi:hypothetical protein